MSYEAYFDHINSLPEDLLRIHEYCWDYTGRPNFDCSYQIAIGRICALCDDWDEFNFKCQQFFFEPSGKDEFKLTLAWHCYIKGMTVLADKMKERV